MVSQSVTSHMERIVFIKTKNKKKKEILHFFRFFFPVFRETVATGVMFLLGLPQQVDEKLYLELVPPQPRTFKTSS